MIVELDGEAVWKIKKKVGSRNMPDLHRDLAELDQKSRRSS
jgi:hypothetical protein